MGHKFNSLLIFPKIYQDDSYHATYPIYLSQNQNHRPSMLVSNYPHTILSAYP